MPLSRASKAALISAAVGLSVIGLLAIYFRRKKPPNTGRRRMLLRDGRQERQRFTSLSSIKSPLNGEIPRSEPNSQYSGSPATQTRSANVKLASGRRRDDSESTNISVTTLIGSDDTDSEEKSPQHLCQLGLSSIHSAINNFEMAINQIDDQSQDGQSDVHCMRQLIEVMIEQANQIQFDYDRALDHQVSSAAIDSALTALADMNRIYDRDRRDGDSESDADSFVSASEMADMSDLDEMFHKHHQLYLYDSALRELKHGSIPCRVLRTKLVGCKSDVDFLAKLHCIRLAFSDLMLDESIKKYFTETGKQLLIDMLTLAGKETDDFEESFEELMIWVEDSDNWTKMEEELRGRGVKLFTFFDVVLDFILMDAFDDLASPPSSVSTVTHNRWLSNGFKETALTTAVWSVLKAKRRMLKMKNGFISHFYAVSETISPTLAWGFLGPLPELNELCYFFKNLVTDFISDLFDFGKCRFTTVPQLAGDIMVVTRQRAHQASQRLHQEELLPR